MLTNQIYHSQQKQQQQLALFPHILSPNQIKMEANREEYTHMNRDMTSLILHTNNFGFDQNNNSDENSRIVDDMLLYKSYYATNTNSKLDTCLAIDCSLAHSQLTPACLSSSSSTTSTSSSSTSINMNENDGITTSAKTPAQQQHQQQLQHHLKNYNVKKNNFIFKNVNKNIGLLSNTNSPCASSSSECLSSDEGYVGSYSENYEFNRKRHAQLQHQHQQLILYFYNNGLLCPNSETNLDDENVQIEIPALFLSTHEQESFSNLLQLDDNLSLNEKVFPVYESNNNLNKSKVFDELNSSFTLEYDDEIEQLSSRVMSEKLDEQKSDETEMSSSNWRRVVEKRQKNEIKTREFTIEDECDLNAYLNEIDMNIDYSQLDQAYLNSITNSHDVIDQYLKFSNNKMAFNLRKYYQDLHNQKFAKKSSLFANIHVDSIAEFVPVIDTDFAYDDSNYDIESNEYDINEHYVINDEAEYTVIDGEYNDDKTESPNYFDTTVTPNEFDDTESTPALDYDYQNEEYEDYDDQVYIDSLSEEEAIALLRNESEIYALQMAQASKYGLLGESSTKSGKKSKNKSRFNSGHTDDLSKTDIFENVFNYEESLDDDHFEYGDDIYIEDGYALNSNISPSLRNSLLKLRKSRRHLTKLLNLNSQKTVSSNGSSTPSSTTSSLTTSNIGLYKQHIANQSKKPCMYMLAEGRCLRSDCRFVHDLKTITCKYWLEGECLKGENCEFLHEIVEAESVKSHNKSSFGSSFKSKKEAKAKKDFKLDTEEFPALGLSGDKPKQASPKNKPVSLANVVKKTVQKKDFDKQAKNGDEKKEEKKSKKSEHKARAGKNPSSTTPVIQISVKPPNKSGKAKPSSCGSSVTSSGSSSTTSSRANSKIRGKK